MAKSLETITTSWVQYSTVENISTIVKVGTGVILFNEIADDATALKFQGAQNINQQVKQSAGKNTYIRATGAGWEVVITQ